MTVKPYRVDFKYTTFEQASIYIAADTPENAKEGVEAMLSEIAEYDSPEVVAVEEYKKPVTSTTLQ